MEWCWQWKSTNGGTTFTPVIYSQVNMNSCDALDMFSFAVGGDFGDTNNGAVVGYGRSSIL